MIRSLIKVAIYFVVGVLAASCVSFSYDIPSKIIVEEGKGVILLSTGAKEKNGSGSHNLVIRDASGKAVESLHINNYVLKSHFEDHIGFVHAVSLDPGKYEVSLEVLSTLVKPKNREVPPTFQVRAGEIVYLGEVFLTKEPEIFRVTNKLDRDLDKLNSNGANIKKVQVKTSLLSL